ncbi:MAG TPA: DUF2726 domain-containing protein [Anaerolineales bacterium]|nr:DUF2726 domain-containing protein [Anaerolineales bacterium]
MSSAEGMYRNAPTLQKADIFKRNLPFGVCLKQPTSQAIAGNRKSTLNVGTPFLMQSQKNFSVLRGILKAFGLSAEAIDDIVERVEDFLSGGEEKSFDKQEYPYHIKDHFLSPAEHSFFLVLKSAVCDSALISIKVGLHDLFYVKSSDGSKYRIYTNKIDRKHVDFLLCDPKTVQPIAGIELDDKSHQRSDRQVRDEFVENVFRAANLPLIRIPVKHTYSVTELQNLLKPYLVMDRQVSPTVQTSVTEALPHCPKCGSDMVLRTAKSGANQGEKFWGCSKYPQCRGIVKYDVSTK